MTTPADPEAPTMRGLPRPLDELDARQVFADVSRAMFDREIEPVRMGRFVLLERVGMGGMGMVYVAFDPSLDRKVAVKLLHPSRVDGTDEGSEGRTDDGRLGPPGGEQDGDRLRREARALARLRHPNVVTVHEVGLHDDQTFVAMEYVRGQSLEQWLTVERPWRRIVGVFIEAGRGLVAAHEAGLVHRDFKPANVIRQDDGRVVVVDFGLARIDPQLRPELADDSLAGTQTRGIAGTPAYMSPEQLRGEPVQPASDQFSLCVSLWEALCGQRPYAARTLVGLLDAIEQRQITEPRGGRRVPRWLRRALLRGLEPKPADRWPTMQDLLARLERGLAATGRRVALGGALVSITAATTWAWTSPQEPATAATPVDPCVAVVASIDEVWDEDRAERIEASLDGIDEGRSRTGTRTTEALGEYAAAWRRARWATCHASPGPDPRRVDCYDRRLDELAAAVELLEVPDASLHARALELVPSTSTLAECDVQTRADARPPRADGAQDPAAGLLARAQALSGAGRYDEARQLAERALSIAQADDDALLRSRALVRLGRLSMAGGERSQAVEWFSRGLVAAERDGDPVARLLALRGLAEALIEAADFDEAERTLAVAEAAMLRFDPHPPAWDVRMDRLRAQLAYARGRYEQAEAHILAGLARADAAGVDGEELRLTRSRLGPILVRLKRWQEAEVELRELEAELAQHYGPYSPGRAAALNTLGGLMLGRTDGRADPAAAQRALEEALAIRTRRAGPEHPSLLASLQNLAGLHSRAKRYAEALGLMERALAIVRRHELRSYRAADVLRNVAISMAHLERWEEATDYYREATELLAQVRGDDDDARRLRGDAATLARTGRLPEAYDTYRKAFGAILRRDAGPG